MVRATLLVDKYIVAELAVALGGETFLEAVMALSPVEGSVEEDGKVLVQADLPIADYDKLVYYDQLAQSGGLDPDVAITEYALEDLDEDWDVFDDVTFLDVEGQPVGVPEDPATSTVVPTEPAPVTSTGDFLAGTSSV